jgi:serine-type D-Ala-D-Ala carboxypeptidase/endopeptidase (penicillin-binding protein 4)
MNDAGSSSGAYVYDATSRRRLFGRRYGTRRILASNTKLFTTNAVLRRLGPSKRLSTRAMSRRAIDEHGVLSGNLYLAGGGDPTFGSSSFVRDAYGHGATVEALANALRRRGLRRVTGAVVGDETLFDTRRGGPESHYRVSQYVGPLSALSFNRGLANSRGTAFQKSPARFAAQRLDSALARRGIRVDRSPRKGRTARGAHSLAIVRSPTVAALIKLQNKPSDNFFAETLLKGVAAAVNGKGTTRGGAALAERSARALGTSASLVDGSGLSRSDRASPRAVATLLNRFRVQRYFSPFLRSLPIAGRDGTLRNRMRHGPARRRCRAKTGTLSNVSVLSGYCRSRSGHEIVFSILMNRVSPPSARRLQDRMAQAMAGYG